MADTSRLSLPRPTGADLISQGDDILTEMSNTLDNAAMFASGVFASRPAASDLAGRFYYATDTGALFFSTGTAWLHLDSGPGVPIGGSLDYVGGADPSDTRFLLEDGRAISRATYPEFTALMSAQGFPYGNGNGTTTVNIPDSRGRASVAPDDMGTAAGAAGRMATNNTIGASGGTETKTLATGNLPAHTHPSGTLANDTVGDHSHGVGTYAIANESAHTHGVGSYGVSGSGTLNTNNSVSFNTGDESQTHAHVFANYVARDSGIAGLASGSAVNLPSYTVTTTGAESNGHTHVVPPHGHSISSHGHAFTGISAAGSSHTHSFTGSSASAGTHTHAISGSTASAGSGTAFNILGPYVVKNKIVRVL
jgi:microcystin-dependent protein